jgi:3-isopropylmalate dehydrogenase
MLRYSLGREKEAAAIEKAVEDTINGGVRTRDIGGRAGTAEFGDRVVENLKARIS